MISLSNVSIGYGSEPILSNLTFEIPDKGVTCILGPSGIGKTTLMQAISAIKMPISGDMYIFGCKASKMSYFTRYRIWRDILSMHFQINNVIAQETLSYNICFKRFISKSEQSKIRFLLNRLGLDFDLRVRARNLSVGQRNRLSIARAFYKNRKVVVLDEPLASLDIGSQEKVLDLIEECSQDRAIVIASHELIRCGNIVKIIDLKEYSMV